MKVLKIAAVLPALTILCGAGAAKPSAPNPQEVLTEAHYIQQAITPLEEEMQRLAGNAATEQDVRAAIDKFEQACREADLAWQEKGIAVRLDPAVASVRGGQVLEGARASLERGDLPAAREAARGAYESALAIAYAALAENFSAVAELRDETWSFSGWIELANVRLKQREFAQAHQALWQAYAITPALSGEGMEPIRKAFETLSERIGRGLMSRNDYATAKEHFTKYLLAPELQHTEFVHAALGMACFELAEMECAREQFQQAAQTGTGTGREVLARAVRLLQEAEQDPAAYGKLFQLVEMWRGIAPEDAEILKIPATAAQQNAAALQDWMHQTTDCAIKAQVVRGLQQAALAEPYLAEAEEALACDATAATAQRVVSTANYRLAVRAWNELAQRPPADSRAAAPQIENLRALLSRATSSEGAAELSSKVEAYAAKLQEKDRVEAENRRIEREAECATLLKGARWARDQARIALRDLATNLERIKDKSAGCAKYLDEASRQELEQLQPVLAERLQKDCDAEYYRLPDLPSDPSSLTPDQLEIIRPHFEAYHTACGPFIANTFRGEKVDSVMKRLAAPRPSS